MRLFGFFLKTKLKYWIKLSHFTETQLATMWWEWIHSAEVRRGQTLLTCVSSHKYSKVKIEQLILLYCSFNRFIFHQSWTQASVLVCLPVLWHSSPSGASAIRCNKHSRSAGIAPLEGGLWVWEIRFKPMSHVSCSAKALWSQRVKNNYERGHF